MVAFVPVTQGKTIIQYAHQFSDLADHYQLNANSLPHVTLAHFMADKKDLSQIWQKLCLALTPQHITLCLKKFSCITRGGYNWVALLPGEDATLKKMHTIVARIIAPVQKPLTAYEPHLTLINTTDKDYIEKIQPLLNSYTQIKDEFILALGACDAIGQLTDILYLAEGPRNPLGIAK